MKNDTMNSARSSPRKFRAAPLKIKRRPTPPDNAQTILLNRRIFVALVCIRVFNALTVQTFFQPDEYYQSLEPAWKVVYGYGETTWEWREGIRGFLYPSLFASVWWVFKTIGVKDATSLVFGFLNCLMCRLRRPRFCRVFSPHFAITGRTVLQDDCSIITWRDGL